MFAQSSIEGGGIPVQPVQSGDDADSKTPYSGSFTLKLIGPTGPIMSLFGDNSNNNSPPITTTKAHFTFNLEKGLNIFPIDESGHGGEKTEFQRQGDIKITYTTTKIIPYGNDCNEILKQSNTIDRQITIVYVNNKPYLSNLGLYDDTITPSVTFQPLKPNGCNGLSDNNPASIVSNPFVPVNQMPIPGSKSFEGKSDDGFDYEIQISIAGQYPDPCINNKDPKMSHYGKGKWNFDYGYMNGEGLVLKNINIDKQHLFDSISVPHFKLDTGNGKSVYVGFCSDKDPLLTIFSKDIIVDSESGVSHSMDDDTIGWTFKKQFTGENGLKGLLTITYMISFRLQPTTNCELSSWPCYSFLPQVFVDWRGDSNSQPKITVTAYYKLDYGSGVGFVVTKDYDNWFGATVGNTGDQKIQTTEAKFNAVTNGKAGQIDNIHTVHKNQGVFIPGCRYIVKYDCVHMHWRWSASTFPARIDPLIDPIFGDPKPENLRGTPYLVAGQTINLYLVKYHPGEENPDDPSILVNGEEIADAPITSGTTGCFQCVLESADHSIVWYVATSTADQGSSAVFFGHGFFVLDTVPHSLTHSTLSTQEDSDKSANNNLQDNSINSNNTSLSSFSLPPSSSAILSNKNQQDNNNITSSNTTSSSNTPPSLPPSSSSSSNILSRANGFVPINLIGADLTMQIPKNWFEKKFDGKSVSFCSDSDCHSANMTIDVQTYNPTHGSYFSSVNDLPQRVFNGVLYSEKLSGLQILQIRSLGNNHQNVLFSFHDPVSGQDAVGLGVHLIGNGHLYVIHFVATKETWNTFTPIIQYITSTWHYNRR